jgi:hypothetical protein
MAEQAIPDATASHSHKAFAYSSAIDESQVEIKMKGMMSNTEEPKKKKNPFTQYYAQLLHQQNMLQDAVRTGT